MSTFFHSIRWRIQAWHGLILLGAIIAFCVTVYHFAWDYQLRRIDRELQETEHMLIRSLMQSGRQPGTAPLPPEQFAQRLRAGEITLSAETAARFAGSGYFSIHDVDGRPLLQSGNAPRDLAPLAIPEDGFVEQVRSLGPRRESLRGSARGFSSVVGRDITAEQDEMHRFGWVLSASGLGVWLLGLIGGWWLAGRAIKPIDTISRTASRIAEGNLSERIDISGTDSELDQLGLVLNRTFERLDASFERQRRFTADASHELRTPVAILIAETQRILKRERTPEEYREALRTCGDTADRMRRLIEALLTLSRQEADGGTTREPCDLSAILRDIVEHLRPLAAGRAVQIETHLQPAPCRADPAALSILAANLVRNAIQHQAPDSIDRSVHITAGRDGDRVFFVVSDTGPGIKPEDLPHIFERFYRADKARTGDSGHTGLGLAIAHAIVENHGGTIEARSSSGNGATFTVRLPAR